tara:strand:- start:147 stop:1571 length:1425 start_codon:yes stop_codon:yes gene_type:complete
MNYVFYDFETSGNNKDFDQILQIGAVLANDGFQIKDKIDISCRLKKDTIPAPEALLINKISIDQLKSGDISHYSLIQQLKKKFEEWSPACFVGFNSIGFDEDVLRQGLFQSLDYPYLTTSKDNRRMDVLKLARAVSAFAPNSIVVPLGENNKQNFKLGNLTKVNQIDHSNAHDAIADVNATLELAKKIKNNAPEVWDALLNYKKGDDIGRKFFSEDFVCYQDLVFGKLYNFAATFVCFHPVYGKSWLAAFDLKHDPRPLLSLGFTEMKQALFSSPVKIRQVSLNKMPVVLPKDYFSSLDDYKEVGLEEISERAKLVKENQEFCNKVFEILAEKAKEKKEVSSQDEQDYFPENFIHQSSIQMSKEDKTTLYKFQSGNWDEKAKTYFDFQDNVLKHFSRLLIYEENPDSLTQKELSEAEKGIAEKLLTTDQKPWITIPDAMKKIDDLRANEDSDKKFLNDYDLFIQDLESHHKGNL